MSNTATCFVVDNDNYFSPKIVLVIGASISYLCYGYILYLRYIAKLPALSRHPTELSIYKVWYELFFVSQFFWIPFIPESYFWTDSGDSTCESAPKFAFFCFLCQFSLLGAELWFFVLSRDMYLTISNPFSSYKKQAVKFFVGILAVATIFGLVLVGLGPSVYGLSSDPMIWIQDNKQPNFNDDIDSNANQTSVNWNKFYFFYLWMILIYAYSFYVLWFVHDRIRTGIEETLQTRLSYIRRTRIYTIGYAFFWTVVFVLEFVDYIGALKQDSMQRSSVRTTIAFVLASRGVWSLAILVIGNYEDLKLLFLGRSFISSDKLRQAFALQSLKAQTEKYVLSPHLNEALRKEVLLYTTQGIRTAINQNQISRETGKRSIGVMNPSFRSRNSALESFELEEGVFSFSFDEVNVPDVEYDKLCSLQEKGLLSEITRVSTGTDLSQSLLANQQPMQGSPGPKHSEVSIPFGQAPDPLRELASSGSPLHFSSKTFDPLKRFRSRSLRSDFYFKDYASGTFHRIRTLANIDDNEYMDAFKSTTAESFSEGRSGAFMFSSSDEKYIVKTTSAHEMFKLLTMLPQYVRYLVDHPNTLLTKYLSAHAIVMYDTTIYFVVMLNFFPKIVLSERYDLKGSWVDRNGAQAGMTRTERLEGTDGTTNIKNGSHIVPLYKDNDLMERILLKPEAAISVALAIREDILFLRNNGLTDYSLLIGVRRKRFEVFDRHQLQEQQALGEGQAGQLGHNPELAAASNPFKQDKDGGIHAGVVEGPGGYYFGIIDTLQEWTWKKKLEHLVKVYIRLLEPEGISAMEPNSYADRFWNRAVRDVFEYVDDSLVSSIDTVPRLQVRSANNRASTIKIANTSANAEDNDEASVDESVNFERETDRRFSVIPMDMDGKRNGLSFSASRASYMNRYSVSQTNQTEGSGQANSRSTSNNDMAITSSITNENEAKATVTSAEF